MGIFAELVDNLANWPAYIFGDLVSHDSAKAPDGTVSETITNALSAAPDYVREAADSLFASADAGETTDPADEATVNDYLSGLGLREWWGEFWRRFYSSAPTVYPVTPTPDDVKGLRPYAQSWAPWQYLPFLGPDDSLAKMFQGREPWPWDSPDGPLSGPLAFLKWAAIAAIVVLALILAISAIKAVR